MDLDRLRGLLGAPGAEAAWAGQATAGPGDDCDAQIVPVVTGRVDPGVLDRLGAMLLHDTTAGPAQPGSNNVPAAFVPATPDQPCATANAFAPAMPAQPGDGDATRRARGERAARRMIIKAASRTTSSPAPRAVPPAWPT
jgi:hypothetical protein